MVDMRIARLPVFALIVGPLLLGGVVVVAFALIASRDGDGHANPAPPAGIADGTPPCVDGWSQYRDPDGRYSFCYPQEFMLKIGREEPYAVSAEMRHVAGSVSEANVIAFSIFWKPVSRFHAGLLPSRCYLQEQHFAVPVREEVRTVAAQTVVACRAVGNTPSHGVAPLEMEILFPGDEGWLQIGALFGPNLAKGVVLIERIFESLKIPAQPG